MSDLERIKPIFSEALDKKGADREAYLNEACGKDHELKAKVKALLGAHEGAGDFLVSGALGSAVTLESSPLTEGPGTTIGRYKLLEKIGEGGMAVVYMAEQKRPIRRRVALKLIKLGMDTKQVVARFEAERQALAMMDHPNIAKVLDAGKTKTGRPYFVMELVKGVAITEYCDKNKLDTKERLDLFVQVCNAVQHAHQKGIIHRDIKPSNVMVTLRDGKPVPKVIDFGIAKAISQRLTEKTLFTRYAQMIGTPAYMSPEQAEMSELDVDTRTDIYSLGVLLYQLLTGVTPFSEEQLREAGYVEMQRIILEEEPSRPSTKLSTLGDSLTYVAEHRKTEPGMLTKLIRGDLDWIVMKSLEKDRSLRYETIHDLAQDIRHHLNDEPVLAGPPSLSYKMQKFIRRNRIAVITGAIVMVAVVLAVVVLSLSTALIWRAQSRTQKALSREQLAVQDAQYNLYVARMHLGGQYWEAGQIASLSQMLDNCVPETGQRDLRGWEWYYLLSLCHQDLATLCGGTPAVRRVAWSPDSSRIVAGNSDNTAIVWDIPSQTERLVLKGHTGEVMAAAWSPDGATIATGSGDRTIKLWDAHTGKEMATLTGHNDRVASVVWTPDGTRLASAGWTDQTVRIWDVRAGKEQMTLKSPGNAVTGLSLSPDGEYLSSVEYLGWMRIFEMDTGREVRSWRAQEHNLWAVAWSPTGDKIATGGFGPVKIWDPNTGRQLQSLPHEGGVDWLSWSPDGRHIASATRDQQIRIWQVDSGQQIHSYRGHTGWIKCAAWSPDGSRIASAGGDGTVKIWATYKLGGGSGLGHSDVMKIAWSPVEELLATSGRGKIRMWDMDAGKCIRSWDSGQPAVVETSWSPDGKYLASFSEWGGDRETVKIWEVRTGAEVASIATPGACLCWSPDGRNLAIGYRGDSQEDTIIWNVAGKAETMRLKRHGGGTRSVSWSPNGHWLATSGTDGLIHTWNAKTGNLEHTFQGHVRNKNVHVVAWSPDSRFFATGGWDQTIRIWVADEGTEKLTLHGHTGYIKSLLWSPDGSRIASTGRDEMVKIWDALTGRELMTLPYSNVGVEHTITWSHDGKKIAGALADGKIRVWDASAGYEIDSDKSDRISLTGK
ncbi:MAG: protein kinase [Phycisphaerae bacterium]|nr:protein kinase [Phycisphaerae bacterium]NIP52528.1 protein kinase [Phycisphaerae bacterium]NIS53874.1 protein kinase [Phycisphaerae bacterium]NIU10933.1 protein kinase [Phycisphaerae bacterium]NIU59263.1 protein kinase [Phycisphaerae bacterium]